VNDDYLPEFEEGKHAWQSKQPIDSNPYIVGGYAHEAWNKGYEQGRYDQMNEDYDD
jgi:hypothetical protein